MPLIKSIQQQFVDPSSIQNIFQQEFHAELFYSRCQDTGQKPDRQKAKMFKQSFGKINSKKFPQIRREYYNEINIDIINKEMLAYMPQIKRFQTINLADNSISEYGMHAIKSLISSSRIENLNLASNMISEVGLSLILEEMIKNSFIKCLDLGISQGSIRKNSFGIDGSRCLAAILLQNKKLEVLKLQDNDIGINGAEIISIPLKRNKTLKQLKISQNLIKTQGAQYILNNAINLVSLDMGKNFIKSSIGPTLKKYILTNKNLKKLNLQLNQLQGQGAKILFEGIVLANNGQHTTIANTTTMSPTKPNDSNLNTSTNNFHDLNSQMDCGLEQLNLKGNSIGNLGIQMINEAILNHNHQSKIKKLKILDLSCNQLTEQCINGLVGILDSTELSSINLAKNNFGDEGFITLIKQLKQTSTGQSLQRLDVSSIKLSQKGFIFYLQNMNEFGSLRYVKCMDNYISQKYEKLFISLLEKNEMLISLVLQGNRLSLSGMKGIKNIIDRNLKKYEEKQPTRMKSEIYNLKQKQKKIKQAQDKIEAKKRELILLQDNKNKLTQTLAKLQSQQKHFKQQNQDLIRKKMHQLQQISRQGKKKQQILQQTKQQKHKKVKQMQNQLKQLRDRRKALQYQLSVTQNQGQMIERDFQRKIRDIK